MNLKLFPLDNILYREDKTKNYDAQDVSMCEHLKFIYIFNMIK